jgi:hypothetical protein
LKRKKHNHKSRQIVYVNDTWNVWNEIATIMQLFMWMLHEIFETKETQS